MPEAVEWGAIPHVVLGLYLIVLLVFGYLGYRRSAGSEEDYYLNVARNFDFEIQHKTKQGVTRSANGKSLF